MIFRNLPVDFDTPWLQWKWFLGRYRFYIFPAQCLWWDGWRPRAWRLDKYEVGTDASSSKWSGREERRRFAICHWRSISDALPSLSDSKVLILNQVGFFWNLCHDLSWITQSILTFIFALDANRLFQLATLVNWTNIDNIAICCEIRSLLSFKS